MINTFQVKNFKNLEHLILDGLSNVNLIVGKNNVGKSSLLEALGLYCADGSSEYIKELLRKRGEEVVISESTNALSLRERYLSLFTGRKIANDQTYSIVVQKNEDDKGRVSISQAVLTEFEKKDKDGNSVIKRRINFTGLKTSNNTLQNDQAENVLLGFSIYHSGHLSFLPYNKKRIDDIRSKCPFVLVETSDLKDSLNAVFFDNIALTPEEDYVVKALNIINPDIARISFVNDSATNTRIPVVSIKNSPKILRLSSMGDGINRVLTIILALLHCKDGVLLLDEFENGLHYTVQDKLWEIIFMLSKKLNIQVFATSHSNDCIRSFAGAMHDNLGVCIRLDATEKGILPTYYKDKDDILYALNNNIEIR